MDFEICFSQLKNSNIHILFCKQAADGCFKYHNCLILTTLETWPRLASFTFRAHFQQYQILSHLSQVYHLVHIVTQSLFPTSAEENERCNPIPDTTWYIGWNVLKFQKRDFREFFLSIPIYIDVCPSLLPNDSLRSASHIQVRRPHVVTTHYPPDFR